MSYSIVRLQKFTSGSVRGIQSHDRRERDPHTNPDIDKARTAENYALVECLGYNQAVKDKIQTLENKRTVRKDAVVMCQLLVTSDSKFFESLTPEKENAFFIQALDFIADRYGHKNILSATIHKDEKTPHMHVNFVPIKDGRLSAKAIFGDRKELQSLQTDFHRAVGEVWGLERGQSRGDKRRYQDVATIKRTTAQAELEKVQAELTKAKAEQERTKVELERTKAELSTFKGVREGTAQALAQAQAWSIEKARQEVEQRRLEQERQAALERTKAEEKAKEQARERTHSRGPSMGR